MALQKQIDTSKGVPADYWRITERACDFANGTWSLSDSDLRFRIAGFRDKAAREAGAECLSAQDFTLTDFAGPMDELARADLYGHAKAHEMFDGAEDA